MEIDIWGLEERLPTGLDGRARVRGRNCTVEDVVEALSRSEPVAVAAEFDLDPADMLAALARRGLGDETTPRLALIQERPVDRGLAGSLTESAWAPVLPGSSRPARLALAAGLAQMFDFWDQSHEAAQAADDQGEHATAPYWHGVAHRREPDPGNAAYWFRRVGRHPVFQDLGRAARPLLDARGDPSLAAQLTKNGWDPFAMIDLCARPGANEALARSLQRLEIRLLFEATARPLTALRA